MPVRPTLEHVFEIGEWLDVVELGGGDEGATVAQRPAPPVGSGKQVILAASATGRIAPSTASVSSSMPRSSRKWQSRVTVSVL
jgi:hypothetical protein